MRLHEFTDPTKYLPSKIEAAKTAEYAERNPLRNIEDRAATADNPKPKNEASENMMK
jgi:hypothetical protein